MKSSLREDIEDAGGLATRVHQQTKHINDKVRRVKCDEARPSCLRCTSAGRTCDGYEEAEAEQVLQQQSPIQAAIARYGNSQEARSIQFFMERTLSQLTSFFPDEFWGISVLQILQGHTETAIRLFKHGHRMMSQFCQLVAEQHRQATDLNRILNHVQTLFNRLALQVVLLVGDVTPELSLQCVSRSQLMMINAHYTFSSLLEAREALNAILALRLTETVTNPLLVAEFSQWSQAFDKFVISRGGLAFSPGEQRSLALIDLHRRYFNMALPWENINNNPYALSLDNYTSDFEELVNCASRVLGLEDTDTAPLFHLEIGVVPVLFVIVAWCRDPGIRRRAISLLMSRQAQEGVWSSHLTGRVARRIMEAEEEKLDVRSCKDVPGPRRDREWEEAIVW
ncbi:Zn(2)-C6 fungal-type DNA-binding domain [Fusarium agapanthi]|uniref:Zn(2)-C6 fungal-type DNA-binding domain n=1 Tax=Fusarium agapanthi TaxID=1803897 RepID=A0A9P5BJP5_9HYPO|nr:Zn(2)-C6 fungal-type DNA-binding domain [Fusarium agapanthi]